MQLTLSQPYIKGPSKNFTTIFRFCYWQTPESRQQHRQHRAERADLRRQAQPHRPSVEGEARCTGEVTRS